MRTLDENDRGLAMDMHNIIRGDESKIEINQEKFLENIFIHKSQKIPNMFEICSKSNKKGSKKQVWESGVLYLLSQCRELNSGPFPYQGNALPLSYIGFH